METNEDLCTCVFPKRLTAHFHTEKCSTALINHSDRNIDDVAEEKQSSKKTFAPFVFITNKWSVAVCSSDTLIIWNLSGAYTEYLNDLTNIEQDIYKQYLQMTCDVQHDTGYDGLDFCLIPWDLDIFFETFFQPFLHFHME